MSGPQLSGWRPIASAPLDESDILLLAHGMVVEARYSPGEWSEETPLGPREYSGAVWVCFDDQFQFEIEEIGHDPAGWWHGPVTHWRPKSDLFGAAIAQTPSETPHDPS